MFFRGAPSESAFSSLPGVPSIFGQHDQAVFDFTTMTSQATFSLSLRANLVIVQWMNGNSGYLSFKISYRPLSMAFHPFGWLYATSSSVPEVQVALAYTMELYLKLWLYKIVPRSGLEKPTRDTSTHIMH